MKRAPNGTGYLRDGYRIFGKTDGQKREHVLIAERAIGKALPKGAEVHHVNGNKSDNRPGNLVICQDRAFHQLLHLRARAYHACGHADWRRCMACRQWDDPASLIVPLGNGGGVFHPACRNEYQRARYQRRKARSRATATAKP